MVCLLFLLADKLEEIIKRNDDSEQIKLNILSFGGITRIARKLQNQHLRYMHQNI